MNPTLNQNGDVSCGGSDHWNRRSLLKTAGWSGLAWLTPLSGLLALEAEKAPKGRPARSVILLWMSGGCSQWETFDPHAAISGDGAIDTAVKGVQLASSMPRLAEVMGDVSLIRSVVSKEGDHERAVYNMKTGYRPNPSLVHASLGAIVCHELPSPSVEIPTHISILPSIWPARGGYFGAQFDAFKLGDPNAPLPDLKALGGADRQAERLKNLSVVEDAFARGRLADLEKSRTLHSLTMANAQKLMTSDQLAAFDVSNETAEVRAAYGDTPFGRGCLAARRLIEAGVRCVEVNLDGWDSHINNHELTRGRVKVLDPAFAALIKDLKQRGLLEHTIVMCGTEFGRTPKLNPVDGRDHWPHAFSVAMAGGGLAGGKVLGATDPKGEKKEPDRPVKVADIHATVQAALGIDPEAEVMTPANRPMAFSEGAPIKELLPA